MMLENERLQVRFAQPQTIQTQRFDHTAMVEQVTLDGKYTFCTPEQRLPQRRTTHGFGLCGEFVLEGAAEEAAAGDWFVKPGVGLLLQRGSGMPYDMWQRYECRPFPVTVQRRGDSLVFCQTGETANGYGFSVEKIFSLDGNALVLEIAVRNTGERDAPLKEYQHNFVSLNQQPVGSGYGLAIPCDRNLRQILHKTLRQGDEAVMPSVVQMQGNMVVWKTDMDQRIVYHSSCDTVDTPPWGWTLSCASLGLTVQETVDFRPSRVDVWSVEHCVSPELYHTAIIAPGEISRWRRSWRFDAARPE